MRFWPVPKSYSKKIPVKGEQGSFWEDRNDRNHCGVDIYAPVGSDVVSIEDGRVIGVGVSTSSQEIYYWNQTFYILIKNQTGLFCKYAELGSIDVEVGDSVRVGQKIGVVGPVLNLDGINCATPLYIQKLKDSGKASMLHFELYNSKPTKSLKYLGGNWFGLRMPKGLIDPTEYLTSTSRI